MSHPTIRRLPEEEELLRKREEFIAVQDRTGGRRRPLKAGRLWDGIERFQDEVSLSGWCEPVQIIRESESVVPAAGPTAGFASDREATESTPGR
jgi:hypothetical protein